MKAGILPLMVGVLLFAAVNPVPIQGDDDPSPPGETVKLIFIHHSTGENWLADGYGNLGQTLDQNNYFVSDTNYGWGPDAIGDRTDIPNWTEWFASDNTPTYMDALFHESGQHASYTRTLPDPGGENVIVMFKSCFPNSALEGNPSDPPDPEGWLTVGHAKYVYNEILKYFATRPDKFFVLITAPPLTDPTYTENARAFNEWLMNDWLRENNYQLNNVFVFDFYNVLTGSDAHHRYNNGQVEHVIGDKNTLYYPSGDDHPSEKGSQKATDEFVSLLNVYYHRWLENTPVPSANATEPVVQAPTESASVAPVIAAENIADFESSIPSLNAYWDEETNTRITCAASSDVAYDGTSSLKIEFDVMAGSWATCVISFESVQNWSSGQGLSFAIHSEQAEIPYNIDIYSGPQDARETYLDSASTPTDSVDGWATVDIPWNEFHRADWEENGGAVFNTPDQIHEIAIGFNGLDTSNNSGVIWVDNVHLMGQESAQPEAQPTLEQSEQPNNKPGLPCVGGVLFPLLFLSLTRFKTRKQ